MMVWVGISHNGKTQLVTVNGTLNAQKYRRHSCPSGFAVHAGR